jgi:hypothetical protein
VAAWLKLAGKIVRITSSTDEVDHLSAKLRRIRWTCSWHRQHLWRETQGVHQTGSIPLLGDAEGASELPSVHRRGADVARFAGLDDIMQRFERLLDRRVMVEAVDLIQVDQRLRVCDRRRTVGRHRRRAARRGLLAKGLPPTYVFLSACVFAAMAAIATAFLALPGRQPIRMAAMEVAS